MCEAGVYLFVWSSLVQVKVELSPKPAAEGSGSVRAGKALTFKDVAARQAALASSEQEVVRLRAEVAEARLEVEQWKQRAQQAEKAEAKAIRVMWWC